MGPCRSNPMTLGIIGERKSELQADSPVPIRANDRAGWLSQNAVAAVGFEAVVETVMPHGDTYGGPV
jgi:hypothetical protein